MSRGKARARSRVEQWDLVVVGGGTAGLLGAKTATRLGARVLLIEGNRTGGDCLWTGCVPSKALIAAASAAAGVRRAEGLGIKTGEVTIDFAAIQSHIAQAIATIAPTDSIPALQSAGIEVRRGQARFSTPNTLHIHPAEESLGRAEESPGRAEESLTFRHALIATGAGPTVPPIPGLAAVKHFTSDTIWNLTELPKRLVIIGGGSIGCELGQAFARLGSLVTMVEQGSRILPQEDPWAALVVGAALKADGVRLLHNQPVVEATASHLVLADGDRVEFDVLLLAVGRTPRTAGLGLAAAGVRLDEGGHVVVDDLLRTTNPQIWAAGDVTGHPKFTHVAGVHGALAASNALLGIRRKADLTRLPRVTFTHPEIATVGMSTDKVPRGHRVLHADHADLDRAIADAETAGFTKLVVNKQGHLTGATVVGPRAGETIGEVALAVTHRLKASDLAATMHPYPTYNDAVWNAAVADYFAGLDKPFNRAILRRWLRWRTR